MFVIISFIVKMLFSFQHLYTIIHAEKIQIISWNIQLFSTIYNTMIICKSAHASLDHYIYWLFVNVNRHILILIPVFHLQKAEEANWSSLGNICFSLGYVHRSISMNTVQQKHETALQDAFTAKRFHVFERRIYVKAQMCWYWC